VWSAPANFSFTINKAFWETWWFRLIIILLASSIIGLIFRNRVKQIRAGANIKSRLHELEMKALKAQMNPHFVHNALNSIQSLIINHKTEEAGSYISKFAKLLRQVFENSEKNQISLDKEMYSLRLYVDIEKLRMDMDIEYIEHIDTDLHLSSVMIPPFILQPFVENSLWHGLSTKMGHKYIHINVSRKEDWLIVGITDNGTGRSTSDQSQPFPEGSFSKAVNITRQRIVDFNKFPSVDPVQFSDLKNEEGNASGTTVLISLRAF
jgi:LytS/YehU family sensor histidine kinase